MQRVAIEASKQAARIAELERELLESKTRIETLTQQLE